MKYFKSHSEFINEAKLSAIHKAAKKGSYPVTVVVVSNGSVTKQEIVNTPAAVPAVFNELQKEYPGATINIESKTGETLFVESTITEAKFTKRSLMKAMKKDDGMIQLGNGQEYVIYNPNNGNDDNADMWQDKVIFGLDQDGEEHEIEYSDIVRYDESAVTEATDLNDPVLVAYRATSRDLPKLKIPKLKSRRLSFDKYMDLLDARLDIDQQIKDLRDEMAQTLRDMEQEAEPEGGEVADRYGSTMMKQEKEYTKLMAKKDKIMARIDKHRMA